MRKQLSALAVTAIAAGAVTLATPSTSAWAAGWTHAHNITVEANTTTTSRVVDVAAWGDGFAAAVWFEDGVGDRRVMASRFNPTVGDGEWEPAVAVSTAGRYAYEPQVSVNDNGDVVVAWTEPHDGVEELFAAVRPVAGAWSAPKLLTPGATNVTNDLDVGIANDKTVYATAEYKDADDANFGVRVVEWAYPAAPDGPVTVASNGGDPSLDVSGSGEVIVAFKNYAQDAYAYTRHSPGGIWTAATTLGEAGTPRSSVAINDGGRSAVAYSQSGSPRIRVQLVDPNGAKHGSATVLASELGESTPAIDINNSNRLLVAWQDFAGSDTTLAVAQSGFGGAWTVTETPTPTDDVDWVDVDLGESGTQAIGFASGGRQVLHYRPRPAAALTTWVSHAAYADHQAIAVDQVGNIVAVGAVEGPQVALHARYLDAVGPTTATDEWPQAVLDTELALTGTVPFKAVGFDWLSGLESVDVIARIARWNQAEYGAGTVLLNDQPAFETLPFAPLPGRSYCLGVRGTDGVGNIGRVLDETCFTTPLDDPALKGKGWTRTTGAAHYRHTITTTKHQGRVLVRKGVRAQHLALVVGTAPGAGRVVVRLGKQLLGSYSLKGEHGHRVIDVATFAKVRTGIVRIKVVSPTGKIVRIDGLVVSK